MSKKPRSFYLDIASAEIFFFISDVHCKGINLSLRSSVLHPETHLFSIDCGHCTNTPITTQCCQFETMKDVEDCTVNKTDC